MELLEIIPVPPNDISKLFLNWMNE